MTTRHVLLAVTAALIWGATFVVTKAALDHVPPLFFAALRFVLAACFTVAVPRPALSWRALTAVGLLLGVGQYGFLFIAMTKGVAPGIASLLVHTQAFFTILVAVLFLGERLRPRQISAVLLAFAGLALLVLDREGGVPATGLALVLAAALSGGLGNIALKQLGGVDMRAVAIWMSVVPPLPLLGLSLAFEDTTSIVGGLLAAPWVIIGATVYSAVLATIAAFTIWGRLFALYPASTVAPFFLLVPVFGMGCSALFLGERLSPVATAAAAAIFVGLTLLSWPQRRQADP